MYADSPGLAAKLPFVITWGLLLTVANRVITEGVRMIVNDIALFSRMEPVLNTVDWKSIISINML